MGNKVTCGTCVYEEKGICILKKVKTKPNKRRICDKHCTDTKKIKFTQEIPSIRRPDWFWDKEERRRLRKEFLENIAKNITDSAKKEITMVDSKDSKHPLTGDLSRFQTTAGTEEKKEKE